MANIVYGPAPVPVNVNIVPIGPIDRAPAPVNPAVDPGIAPTGANANVRVQANISVTSVTPNVASSGNVVVTTPLYLTILQNGNLVLKKIDTLNFQGSGVSISGQGDVANISITGGGGGTPGGANTQVQFNDSGAFGGSSAFTFNKTTNILGVSGNVSAAGNISANYFVGNGRALTGITATANTGSIGFVGDAIYDLNGIIIENADLSHGATAAVILPSNGNSVTPVQINNTYGDVSLTTGIDPGNLQTWTFSADGNLNFPGTGSIRNFANTSLDPATPTASTMVLTPDGNYLYQALVLDPTAPGHIHLRSIAGEGGNIDQPVANIFVGGELSSFEVGASYGDAPNVFVHSNGNTWTFSGDGNLTMPGNLVIGSAAGGSSILQYDAPFQIVSEGANAFMATGWAETTNGPGNIAIIGFNAPFNNGVANVVVATGNNGGSQYTWTFDNTGNLNLPNNGVIAITSDYAVAIGPLAGTGGSSAVSLGYGAGTNAQSFSAVAVGGLAGANTQGGGAVAVGNGAGNDTQGAGAIAIGPNAGQFNQGISAIAIGGSAGYNNQANNSIVINASDSQLDNPTANSFVVAPVRNDVANVGEIVFYNTASKEVTYGNTVSIAGNITASNFNVIKSGFNQLSPSIQIDNARFNIDNAGNPTVGAISGTWGGPYTVQAQLWSGTNYPVTTFGSNNATWTSIASYGFGVTFANPGDQVVGYFTDNGNGHVYKVTWIATAGGPSSGYGFIQVEKLV